MRFADPAGALLSGLFLASVGKRPRCRRARGLNIRPIAEIIEKRGLPFLFVTGYGPAGLPEPFRERPVLSKPCMIENLQQAIDRLLVS
jgi:hypothetical protein